VRFLEDPEEQSNQYPLSETSAIVSVDSSHLNKSNSSNRQKLTPSTEVPKLARESTGKGDTLSRNLILESLVRSRYGSSAHPSTEAHNFVVTGCTMISSRLSFAIA
jgi:hypothetical protein